MAQRVLAVLGAIGLVLAAIAVRNAIDDDNTDDPNGDDSTSSNVICAVLPACNELEGRNVGVASSESVLSDLADGEADDVGVWVTTSAWAEIVEARTPDVVAEVRTLATSPAIVAALPERAGALMDACGGQPLWRCLGASSGQPWSSLGGQPGWGSLTVGLTDPDDALGLPVLASAAAGYFDSVDFARNDFDDAFQSWLGNLAEDRAERSPVKTMVTAAGRYSAAGAVLAQARLDAGSRPVEFLEPQPAVPTTVVAIRFDGARFPDLTPVTNALLDAGWEPTPGDAYAPTLKPGVMAALLTLWTEVR